MFSRIATDGRSGTHAEMPCVGSNPRRIRGGAPGAPRPRRQPRHFQTEKKTKIEVPCAHRFARDAAEARVAGRAEAMCVTTSPRTRRPDDARGVPSVRTPSRASPRRRPRNATRAVPSAVSQSGTRTQFGAGRCVEPSPFSATRARMNRTVSQPPSIEAVRVSSRDAAKSGGVLAPRRARALPKRATPLRSSTSAFIQILFWAFRKYPRKP